MKGTQERVKLTHFIKISKHSSEGENERWGSRRRHGRAWRNKGETAALCNGLGDLPPSHTHTHTNTHTLTQRAHTHDVQHNTHTHTHTHTQPLKRSNGK